MRFRHSYCCCCQTLEIIVKSAYWEDRSWLVRGGKVRRGVKLDNIFIHGSVSRAVYEYMKRRSLMEMQCCSRQLKLNLILFCTDIFITMSTKSLLCDFHSFFFEEAHCLCKVRHTGFIIRCTVYLKLYCSTYYSKCHQHVFSSDELSGRLNVSEFVRLQYH